MKKVLVFGVFDLFHFGHLRLLKRASQLGDYLIVAVQTNERISSYKSAPCEIGTLYNLDERMEMIRALRWVDEVIPYNVVAEDIKNIDFDVYVKGPDNVHAGIVAETEWCEENHKEVVVLPRTEGISSTYLKRIMMDFQDKSESKSIDSL
jgi:glycerol-3-phosphate cytidylyltransferase